MKNIFFYLIFLFSLNYIYSQSFEDYNIILEKIKADPQQVYYLYKAVNILESLFNKNPNDPTPLVLAADIYDKHYSIDRAIELYEKVLSLFPDYYNEYLNINYSLGNLYAKKGNLEKSESNFIKASKFQNINFQLLDNSLEALQYYKIANKPDINLDEKIEFLEKCLKRREDWISASIMLFECYMKKGDYQLARKELENAYKFCDVKSINLPGNFLQVNWNKDANPMKYIGNGIWEKQVKLKKGINEYKFSINKNQNYLTDPLNPKTVDFNKNSVIIGNFNGEVTNIYYYTLPIDQIFLNIKNKFENFNKIVKEYYFNDFYPISNTNIPISYTFNIQLNKKIDKLYLVGTFNNFKKDPDFLLSNYNQTNYTFTISLYPGKYLYQLKDEYNIIYVDWNANDFFYDEENCEIFSSLIIGGISSNINKLYPVEFTFTPPMNPNLVKTVYLSGSFNYWAGTKLGYKDKISIYGYKMNIQNNTYYYKTYLPPGKYSYKFIVNNNKWFEDPNAYDYEDDGLGGKNSIIYVGPNYEALISKLAKGIKFVFNINNYQNVFNLDKSGKIYLSPPENINIVGTRIINNKLVGLVFSGDYPLYNGKLKFTIPVEKLNVNQEEFQKYLQRTYTVDFIYHDPEAKVVELRGSFNNWGEKTIYMKKNLEDNLWYTSLELPLGFYEYKFFINNSIYREDPNNELKVPDGFGGFNSVISAGINEISSEILSQFNFPDDVKINEIYLITTKNNWQINNNYKFKQQQNKEMFEYTLFSPERRIIYNFVIKTSYEGELYINDPLASETYLDEKGVLRSVKFNE